MAFFCEAIWNLRKIAWVVHTKSKTEREFIKLFWFAEDIIMSIENPTESIDKLGKPRSSLRLQDRKSIIFHYRPKGNICNV